MSISSPRSTLDTHAHSSSDRIPTEFQYEQNIGSRGAQRTRWVLERLFRINPILPAETIKLFAQSYYDADPVAEAFIEEVYLGRSVAEGRAMVDAALESGVDSVSDAPDSLRQLFTEVERKPDWLDEDLVRLGARVFRRWGTHLYSFAGAITIHGYLENSVSKPLALTGAYGGESANRRFLETAQFWIDVSEPDGLVRGGQGLKTAVRVRLMHVLVRARLLSHPEWDLDAWGVPISQGDALLTLMGGSFLPAMLLRFMGYRTTRRELEATLHFWRYVGYLVGVQPRWYPNTVEDALKLMFTAHVKGARKAGGDARELAQSYVALYAPKNSPDTGSVFASLVKRWEYHLQRGYVGFFVPGSTQRRYQLQPARLWRLHPLLQAPLIFMRETVRRRSALVDEWWDGRVRARTKRWVKARMGRRTVEYKAVEAFTR